MNSIKQNLKKTSQLYFNFSCTLHINHIFFSNITIPIHFSFKFKTNLTFPFKSATISPEVTLLNPQTLTIVFRTKLIILKFFINTNKIYKISYNNSIK